MSMMKGADVERLRQLAKQLEQQGLQITRIRDELNGPVDQITWHGADSQQFKNDWKNAHRAALNNASSTLTTAAALLRRNADAQEATSNEYDSTASVSGIANAQDHTGTARENSWLDMTDKERQGLSIEELRRFGSDTELSPTIRDQANRIYLEKYMGQLKDPGGIFWWENDQYEDKMRALKQIKESLEGHPDAQLISFDPDAPDSIRVAISLGPVDRSDHIAVYVQGMNSRTDSADGLSHPISDMAALRAQAGSDTAMVVWMEYDAPQGSEVFSRGFADAGATQLADFLNNIHHHNPGAQLDLLGHSYGSTVAGLAVRQTDVVNDLIIIGSPGIGTDDLNDLRIKGDLWVGKAQWDVTANSGVYGADPSGIEGARSFDTGGGQNPFNAHDSYLVNGSTSQRSIADILRRH